MTVPNYPSNNVGRDTTSNSKKPISDKDVKRVTKGRVIRRKKKSTPFSENVNEVLGYVATDVIVPMVKEMFVDSIVQGVERAVYGDSRPKTKRPADRNGSGYISYHRYGSSPKNRIPAQPAKRTMSKTHRARHDFSDILCSTRDEANSVLDSMYDLISTYGFTTVADLYSLTGIESFHTDENWGWYNLDGSGVRNVRSGFLLDLPEPEFLD